MTLQQTVSHSLRFAGGLHYLIDVKDHYNKLTNPTSLSLPEGKNGGAKRADELRIYSQGSDIDLKQAL